MSKFLGLIGLRWMLPLSRNKAGEGEEEAQSTDATTPDEVEPQPDAVEPQSVVESETMDDRLTRSRNEVTRLRRQIEENEFRDHRIQTESENKSRHIRELQEELAELSRRLKSETQRKEYAESELSHHTRVAAEHEEILKYVTEELEMKNECLAKSRREMELLKHEYVAKSQESQDQCRSSQKHTKELEEKLDKQCRLLNNERANMQEEKAGFQKSLQSKEAENRTLSQQLSEARKQLKMSEKQDSARAANDLKKYETLEKVMKTQIDKAKDFETKCNALVLKADALRKSMEKQTVDAEAERSKYQSMEKQYAEANRKKELECVMLKQQLSQFETQTRISEMEKQKNESLEEQIRRQLDSEIKMKSEVDAALNQTLQYRRKVTALKRKNALASKRVATIEMQHKHYIIRTKRRFQGLRKILTNHKKSLTYLNRTLLQEMSKSEEFEKQIQNKDSIIRNFVLNIQTSGAQLKEFRKKESDLSALTVENQVLKQKLSESTGKFNDRCKMLEEERKLGNSVASQLKLQRQREIETDVKLRRSNVQLIELQKKIVSLEKELADTKGNLSLMCINHEKVVCNLISEAKKFELRICELQNLVKDQEKNFLEESNKLRLANEQCQFEVNLKLCSENQLRKELELSKSTSMQKENALTLCKSKIKELVQKLVHLTNTLEEWKKHLDSEKKKNEAFELQLNHHMEVNKQLNSKLQNISSEKVQCEEKLLLISKRLEESNEVNEHLKLELNKKSESEHKILDSKLKELQRQMDEQNVMFTEEEKRCSELQQRFEQEQKTLKHRNRQMKSFRTKYRKEKMKLSEVKKRVLRKFNYVKLCSAISEAKLATTVEMKNKKIAELEKKFNGLKKRLILLLNTYSFKRRQPKVTKRCLDRQNIENILAGGDNIHSGLHIQLPVQLLKSGKGKMYGKPKDVNNEKFEGKATADAATAANQFQSLSSEHEVGINIESEEERLSSKDRYEEDGTGIVDQHTNNVEHRETETAMANVILVSLPRSAISGASKNFVKLNPLRMDEVRVEELRNRLQPLQRSISNDTKLGLQNMTKQEIQEKESDEGGKKHKQEDDTECRPIKRVKLDNKDVLEASVQVKHEPVDNYNYGAVTVASTSQQQVNRPMMSEQLLTVKQEPKVEALASGNIRANNSAAGNSTAKEPKLIHTFRPHNLNSAVTGITTLDSQLFLVCKRSSVIEVFDANTFSYKGSVAVRELSNPVFMTACQSNQCLYVFNKGNTNNEILRLVTASEWLHMKCTKWSVGTDFGDLATTRWGTLLFASFLDSTIKEFAADGRLIREIKLKHCFGLKPKLFGAVELKSDGQLVVCYGNPNGCVRNVSLLSGDGKLGAFLCRGVTGSSVQHMVVGSTGALFAVDFGQKEVLYWYPCLSAFKTIHPRKSPDYWPLRIAVDKHDTRMFLAERDDELNNCRISVYDIQ